MLEKTDDTDDTEVKGESTDCNVKVSYEEEQ
jgi:hypothetical protein